MSTQHATPAAGDAPLSEAVQKLHVLHAHLDCAAYDKFWNTLDSDDLYADLIADVAGFEELMRVRIAACVGQVTREVERGRLEGWLNMGGSEMEGFVRETCGWRVDGDRILVGVNKENEAKGTVVRENVKFDRELPSACLLDLMWPSDERRKHEMAANVCVCVCAEFARMIHRAYEQPA